MSWVCLLQAVADNKFLKLPQTLPYHFFAQKLEIELWVFVKNRVSVYKVQSPVSSRCQVTGCSCPGGAIMGVLKARQGGWKC